MIFNAIIDNKTPITTTNLYNKQLFIVEKVGHFTLIINMLQVQFLFKKFSFFYYSILNT